MRNILKVIILILFLFLLGCSDDSSSASKTVTSNTYKYEVIGISGTYEINYLNSEGEYVKKDSIENLTYEFTGSSSQRLYISVINNSFFGKFTLKILINGEVTQEYTAEGIGEGVVYTRE